MLIISKDAKISPLSDIEDSVRGSKITLKAGVVIDAFVKIKPSGGDGDLTICEGSYVNSGTVIYTGNGVLIGKGVAIASNCTLAPVNHAYKARDRPIIGQGFEPSKGGIVIEDDVWIGANVVILDGSIIRRGCVIGACSLVRGHLEEYGVYAGNPLVKLGERH
jgi:acetyltransferase-like isoleucine patch superfamily enzyme